MHSPMSDLAAVEYALFSLGQASPNITASYIQVLYNHIYIQYCPGRIYKYIHVYSTAQGVYIQNHFEFLFVSLHGNIGPSPSILGVRSLLY